MISDLAARSDRSNSKASKIFGLETKEVIHSKQSRMTCSPAAKSSISQKQSPPRNNDSRSRGTMAYCAFRQPRRCRRTGKWLEGRPCSCEVEHERISARDWAETPCESLNAQSKKAKTARRRKDKVRFVIGDVHEVIIVETWITRSEVSEQQDMTSVTDMTSMEPDELAVISPEEIPDFIEGADDADKNTESYRRNAKDFMSENFVAEFGVLTKQGLVDGVGTVDLGLP